MWNLGPPTRDPAKHSEVWMKIPKLCKFLLTLMFLSSALSHLFTISCYARVAVKKKEEWVFLFLFPENKEDKRTRAGLTTMSITEFAFLPSNSAGAIHFTPIFNWLYTKYILYWCLPLQHLVVTYQKESCRALNCQTQSLSYWHQFMAVFETMQEEEIKILPPLFLITVAPDYETPHLI